MAGSFRHHPHFESAHVAARRVDVWLPAGYRAGRRRYGVLYMHDGQNLFDPALSYTGVPWAVDQAVTRLMREQVTPGVIVVGIWNTPRRMQEYMPEKPHAQHGSDRHRRQFAKSYGGDPCSDAYLRFLVEELKPFVDRTYRTRPEAGHTYVAGSSMGGLVSLYALCEYPAVFGAAACLSTSWTVGGRVLVPYLEGGLPDPASHRIYFDYGVEAQIATYESLQARVVRIFRQAGYAPGETLLTRRFPDAAHSEAAWRDRFEVPLRFLLRPRPRRG